MAFSRVIGVAKNVFSYKTLYNVGRVSVFGAKIGAVGAFVGTHSLLMADMVERYRRTPNAEHWENLRGEELAQLVLASTLLAPCIGATYGGLWFVSLPYTALYYAGKSGVLRGK
jgi:hypothetical protein